MQAHRHAPFVALLTLLALLAGCASRPPPATSARGPAAAAEIARAEAAAATGNHAAAASLYEAAAQRAAGAERRHLELLAADEHRAAGNREAARRLASQPPAPTVPEDQLLQRLILAELLLTENRAAEALTQLKPEPPAGLPRPLLRRHLQDLAQAQRATGNHWEAARSLQRLDALLAEDPEARLANQRQIVLTLSELSESALDALAPSARQDERGWVALARLARPGGPAPEALADWRRQYPGHPALPNLLDQLGRQPMGTTGAGRPIAVVLPTEGQFLAAANALRDGMMAAQLALPAAQRPELRFYDAPPAGGTLALVQQAAAAGAEAVIGPLDKAAVSELAAARDLPVPVLALNQVEPTTATPANLYQFALSPEDEARQVADRAWYDGHRTAAVLVPSGSWGERVYASFQQRWLALGGSISEHGVYDLEPNDIPSAVAGVVGLSDSQRRHDELERMLGRKLQFQARPEAAGQALFVAGTPPKVAQIRSQLRGVSPDTLQLYATSHAWNGDLKAQEGDLPPLRLPEVPWLIEDDRESPLSRTRLSASLPASAGSPVARLYPMGIDAMHLVPQLGRLRSRGESFDGQTGILRLDGGRQIERQLIWVELRPDGPRVLGYIGDADGGRSYTRPLPGSSPRPAP
ncbi:MAG: penicillin-binding protein activator [Gammaproteobacteria bacterium]|nr:penicillin-binding protein activator [Gammaproteobacteria bacterium]